MIHMVMVMVIAIVITDCTDWYKIAIRKLQTSENCKLQTAMLLESIDIPEHDSVLQHSFFYVRVLNLYHLVRMREIHVDVKSISS
eukprot:m.87585 g.87585  ORF g.87585 m.87585 type:complete len:85 (-) comp26090_c0_seq1:272-526(-)